jgi:ribosomal protein L37AE/L43A
MPTVSCPSCSTSQTVETGADAYTCVSCGASWTFVTCDTCGSRFHARPGSTGWTCPNCGTPHGTSGGASAQPPASSPIGAAPSLAIKGDDLDAIEPEPLGGPQQPLGSNEPGSPFPMPRRADRGGIPPWVFIAAGALVLIVIVAVVFALRDGEEAVQTPPPDAAAVKATLCSDIQQLQVLRADALGRAQDDLEGDAAALKEAGDKATAKKANQLVAAVDDVRAALEEQQDIGPTTDAMANAITALDC